MSLFVKSKIAAYKAAIYWFIYMYIGFFLQVLDAYYLAPAPANTAAATSAAGVKYAEYE